MKTELKSGAMAAKAVLYQMVFAYTWAYIFFEFSKVMVGGYSFSFTTVIAILLLAGYAAILFLPVDRLVVRLKGGSKA